MLLGAFVIFLLYFHVWGHAFPMGEDIPAGVQRLSMAISRLTLTVLSLAATMGIIVSGVEDS